MKNIYLIIFIFINFFLTANAQQIGFTYSTTTIQVPLAGVIDASGTSQDFDPKLLLIKSALPMPFNEVKQKKSALDQVRLLYNSNLKNQAPSFQKTAASTPLLSTNFIANFTNGTPNDNDIAISNGGKIVSVTNTSLYMYNDTGLMTSQKSLSFFASKLGNLNRTYDPRVIYDPKKDRFIVVFLQGSDHFDTRIIVAFQKQTTQQNCGIFIRFQEILLLETAPGVIIRLFHLLMMNYLLP